MRQILKLPTKWMNWPLSLRSRRKKMRRRKYKRKRWVKLTSATLSQPKRWKENLLIRTTYLIGQKRKKPDEDYTRMRTETWYPTKSIKFFLSCKREANRSIFSPGFGPKILQGLRNTQSEGSTYTRTCWRRRQGTTATSSSSDFLDRFTSLSAEFGPSNSSGTTLNLLACWLVIFWTKTASPLY